MLKHSILKKITLAITLAASSIFMSMPTANAVTNKFTDVEQQLKNTNYHNQMKTAIYDLSGRKIINGKNATTFAPFEPIKRKDAAVLIAKAIGINLDAAPKPAFTDIDSNKYYYKAVAALTDQGIMNGINAKQFSPDGLVTRGQMAKILYEAYKTQLPSTFSFHPFSDVQSFANQSVSTLFELEIINGKSDTSFGGTLSIQRGDVALLIYNTEKYIKSPTENKTQVTINAAQYGFKSFNQSIFDLEGIYSATEKSTSIKFSGIKEGLGKVYLNGVDQANNPKSAFYLVNVDRINNRLVVTLEKANLADYLDVVPQYYTYRDVAIGFKPVIETLKNDKGEQVASNLYSINLDDEGFDLAIYEPGKYTLTLETGTLRKTLNVDVTIYNFETKLDLY